MAYIATEDSTLTPAAIAGCTLSADAAAAAATLRRVTQVGPANMDMGSKHAQVCASRGAAACARRCAAVAMFAVAQRGHSLAE